MNLDHSPDKSSPAANAAVWFCAIGCLAAVLGYLGWTVLSDSFAASQSRLHPIAVPQIIWDQLTQASPPWEWHVPLWSLLAWFLWFIGTWGGGWILLQWLWPEDKTTPQSVRAVMAFAVGFCIIGIAQAIIGLAGFATFPLFIAADIAVLLALRQSQNFRDDLTSFRRAATWQWRATKPATRWIIIAGVTAAAFMLVPALTPPIQSDAVRYHLGAPQEYLKLGRIAYLPLNAYSNMPFLVEMHFMSALACRAPEATQLIHFTLAILTVLAIYAALRLQQRSSSTANHAPQLLLFLASSLYFFTPMSAVLASWPFTDHGISFMLVASLIAMLLCMQSTGQSRRSWILLGLCLGGLISTKYTMAPIAVVILLATLISNWRSSQITIAARTLLAHSFIAGMVCLLVGGIWFVKNLIFTGNPFYPLASGLFPGGDWGAVNDKFLHDRAGLKGMGQSVVAFFEAPWNATFHWIQFESHDPGVTILIALIFVIGGLIVCRKLPCLRGRIAIGVVIISTIFVWFFSYQSNRLLLPTLAAALCLTPIHTFAGRSFPRRITNIALVIACASGIAWSIQWSWIATALSPRPLPYLLGAQDAASYRYKSLTYARAFDYLNEQVPPDEKVLLVGEHRIYGAKFDAIWSDWFDTPALIAILRREHLTSTQTLLNYLRAHNINWIVINEAELAPQLEQSFRPWFSPQEWQIFQELRELDSPVAHRIEFPPGVTILKLEPQS